MESIAAPATLVDDEAGFIAALKAASAEDRSANFASRLDSVKNAETTPNASSLRPTAYSLRTSFARANSWRARFERLEEIVAAVPPREP
jgi:methylthioribose-1-phosphate isomerase